MCLSIAMQRPEGILAKGEHAGFEWMVIHNGSGFRCGYVRIPPTHPWHGKHYFDIDGADVHGGLTFAEPDESCVKGGPDDAWWLGFDCAHSGDAPDPDLPTRGGRDGRRTDYDDGIVRGQEYVEAECRSLCEQAAAQAVRTAS